MTWVGSLDAAQKTDQLLIVAAEGTEADVTLWEKGAAGAWGQVLSVRGYVGASGIGKMKEGDSRTPTGVYGFTMAFGAKPDPGCAIPYTVLDDTQYWVDDPKSAYYNKFVSTRDVAKDWDSAEHLLAIGAAYNYALALDYNAACIPGEGSAVFLHCSTGSPTGGCVAIPEAQMKTLLERIKPGALIVIDTPEGVKTY